MKLTLIATAAAAAVGVANAGDLMSCTGAVLTFMIGPCAIGTGSGTCGAVGCCLTDSAVDCPTVCPDACQADIDTVHAECGGVTNGDGDEWDITGQPELAAVAAKFGCRCEHLHSLHNTHHTPHNTHTHTPQQHTKARDNIMLPFACITSTLHRLNTRC